VIAMTNSGYDEYETDAREFIGYSLAEAVAWARANPAKFALTHVWWLRSDDAEAVIVDADIRDEIRAEADAAIPTETTVQSEAA
jgi:hypothetical protein